MVIVTHFCFKCSKELLQVVQDTCNNGVTNIRNKGLGKAVKKEEDNDKSRFFSQKVRFFCFDGIRKELRNNFYRINMMRFLGSAAYFICMKCVSSKLHGFNLCVTIINNGKLLYFDSHKDTTTQPLNSSQKRHRRNSSASDKSSSNDRLSLVDKKKRKRLNCSLESSDSDEISIIENPTPTKSPNALSGHVGVRDDNAQGKGANLGI